MESESEDNNDISIHYDGKGREGFDILTLLENQYTLRSKVILLNPIRKYCNLNTVSPSLT